MDRHVLFTAEAVEDLQEIRTWFGQGGAGASAAKTIQAVLAGVERLKTYPNIGRGRVVDGTREYIVRQHRILYIVGNEEITVLAIFGPGQSGYKLA